MEKTHNAEKNFLEKHCNMFRGCIFKFSGLEKDTEAFFIKIVKDLGATVSNDASITFVDFPSCDQQSDDLYSLVYIWDSIQAGKSLALDKYRFHRQGADCEESDKDINTSRISDKNDNTQVGNPLYKYSSSQMQNKVSNRKGKQSQELAEEKQICSQIKSGRVKVKEEFKMTRSYSPSDSEIEVMVDVENLGWRDKYPLKNETRNQEMNQLRAGSPDSHISDLSDDESSYGYYKQWWLPHEIPRNKLCQIKNCTFEPEEHESHFGVAHRMSDTEKKIVVKYLIKHNRIASAKGLKVFEEMIAAGYLTHRTADTLRNNMRRTILNNIYQFSLPPHIRAEFQKLRY